MGILNQSDTEVILKGYNIYGNDIFKKIKGPFYYYMQ